MTLISPLFVETGKFLKRPCTNVLLGTMRCENDELDCYCACAYDQGAIGDDFGYQTNSI